jgi:hypothetical protein
VGRSHVVLGEGHQGHGNNGPSVLGWVWCERVGDKTEGGGGVWVGCESRGENRRSGSDVVFERPETLASDLSHLPPPIRPGHWIYWGQTIAQATFFRGTLGTQLEFGWPLDGRYACRPHRPPYRQGLMSLSLAGVAASSRSVTVGILLVGLRHRPLTAAS